MKDKNDKRSSSYLGMIHYPVHLTGWVAKSFSWHKYHTSIYMSLLLTTMSFPAFSGRFATRVAATVAAPEEMPTYINATKIFLKYSHTLRFIVEQRLFYVYQQAFFKCKLFCHFNRFIARNLQTKWGRFLESYQTQIARHTEICKFSLETDRPIFHLN